MRSPETPATCLGRFILFECPICIFACKQIELMTLHLGIGISCCSSAFTLCGHSIQVVLALVSVFIPVHNVTSCYNYIYWHNNDYEHNSNSEMMLLLASPA